MKLTEEQLDIMIDKLEEIRFKLQTLKEETHKQPFFAAPDPHELLNALSEFMKSDLDYVIRCVEDAQDVLDGVAYEEEGSA